MVLAAQVARSVRASCVGDPGIRRTPGLRREELATLAGISNDYYNSPGTGQGNPPQSPSDRRARTRATAGGRRTRPPAVAGSAGRSTNLHAATATEQDRPLGIPILLGRLRPYPAHVVSRNGDLLAWNPGGLRLLAGIADWPAAQRNVWRYTFLHPTAPILFDDWEGSCAVASPTYGPFVVSNQTHPTSP
jgi:hypothetical protein